MKSYISSFQKKLLKEKQSLKIIYLNETITESEVEHNIIQYALYFKKVGIKEGVRVVVVSKNHPHFVYSVFGLLYIGAIPVLVERTQEKKELFELTCNEPFVITDRTEKYPNSKVYYFDEIDSYLASHELRGKLPTLGVNVDADKTVLMLHSSGTTGIPKKVHYSEGNISWAVHEYYRLYDLGKNNTIAHILPVNCCLAVIACLLLPMYYKKEIVLLDSNNLDMALRSIEKYKINIFPTIPIMYKYMVKMDLDKYNFSSLKICDSGGEILPLAVINKFKQETNVAITEGYGQTETSSLTHFLTPDYKGNLRLGSIGQPCASVRCKVVDNKGKQVKTGDIGELWIKGPMVMKGYDTDNLNQDVFSKGGWFKTGDIVYKDKGNYFYYFARKKDLNLADDKYAIALKDIEEKLYLLADIVEAAVIMMTNLQVKLLIKPSSLSTVDIHTLNKKIHSLLKGSELTVGEIKFVDFIPRTATGKVKKRIILNQ